jgi:hypothetical protein
MTDTVLPVVSEVAHAELDRTFPGEQITLRQLLVGVANLLDDPAHWTTGALAKDASGHSVSPTDPKATCWCAIGATYKVYYDLTGKDEQGKSKERLVLKITQRLMQSASQMLVGERVENMNDNSHGRENLQRVLPLALSIIETAIEQQQGALGEPLGAVTIVDPVAQPDEHDMVQDLEVVNAAETQEEATEILQGTGVGAPIPLDQNPLEGVEPTQSQEATGWDETATGPTEA